MNIHETIARLAAGGPGSGRHKDIGYGNKPIVGRFTTEFANTKADHAASADYHTRMAKQAREYDGGGMTSKESAGLAKLHESAANMHNQAAAGKVSSSAAQEASKVANGSAPGLAQRLANPSTSERIRRSKL